MSGYRQPDFDLDAGGETGAPLRPYTIVQWTGVALALAGIAIDLAYLAGRAGWIAQPLESPTPGIGFLMIGSILINSRRQTLPGDVRTPNRRLLVLVATALVAFAVGLSAILYFQGA